MQDMYIVVCYTGCDAINFEIKIVFLSCRFFYMTKKLRQKFIYLENKKSFQDQMKSIFNHLERAFIEANKTKYF